MKNSLGSSLQSLQNLQNLHTVWAKNEPPVQFSPVCDALLRTIKARFRVVTVTVFMARDGVTVLNAHTGYDPTSLNAEAALALCRDQASELCVMEDIAQQSSEVHAPKSVRFYAGAPLVGSAGGTPAGMLCLVHTEPKGFSRPDRMLLQALANVISAMLLMPHDPVAAQALALSSSKSILLLDPAQTVEAVNARFTELTDFTISDLLKTGVDDLLCLDRPNTGALVVSHAMLAETPARGITRCHTKAGLTLPVEVFVFPLLNKRGRVVKTLLLLAPLFSGPLEDYLLSLRSNERSELLSLHIAGLWSVNNAGLICKLSGAPVAHLHNDVLEQLVGQRLDCVGLFDAAHSDWAGFYQSIAERGLPDEVECCVTHNGHSQWYCMVGFRQYDARGLAMGYHGSFRNITQRKLKEIALLKAQERQALILKGTSDGAWDWDMESGEIYLSPAWWSMMGREPFSQPVTQIWKQFVHPDDIAPLTQIFRTAITQGRDTYQSEFRMLHQHGHYIPVLGRGHVLRNAQGRAVRTSGANQDLTAQRAAQAQIRLLQICVESLQDAVLITHASPRHYPGPLIAYVNPAFESTTGYSFDEVIGKTPRLLQGPQTCRQTLNKITDAMNAWQGIRCELANYKKSGELFWVEIDIIPVKADGSDLFTHWIGVQRNITQRKHAEQVLHTTTDRLNMALEASELGLWTSYVDRDEAFRDSRWQKMLGLPPCDVTTTADDWLKLVHPDDRLAAWSRGEVRSYCTSETFEKEFRMRHTDGRWVWIQSRGKVIAYDADGKPLVLAGTHLDITAKVEARLLSERHNAQLYRCLDLMSMAVVVQRNGVIKFVNAAQLVIFGSRSTNEVIGTPFSAYIVSGDIAKAVWRQQQLMAGAVLPSCWFNCVHRDGHVFKALVSSTVIEWEGERHILSTVTLPSDAALLSEEIEKTRSHFEGLLANQIEKEQVHIAHELHDSLGSQLAGISLQAAGLKLAGSLSLPLTAAVDQLLGNIKLAAEMTRNLARGLAPVDAWPGAIGYALRKLCHDFSSIQGLQCEFEMEGDFDAVTAQTANHLYRITQEAIANALRHGAAQRVNVSLSRSGNAMTLSIFDNGKGFNVRSVIDAPRQGLGLSSMYARAYAIGAQITLEQLVPEGFFVSVSWTQH